MPKKSTKSRRFKRKRSSFSPAVYEAAKILNRAYRSKRAEANYAMLQPYFNPAAVTSNYNSAGNALTVRQAFDALSAQGRGRYTWGNLARSAAGSIAHELGADRGSGRKIGGLLYRTGNRMYAGGGGYVPVGRGEYSGPVTNSLISGSDVSVPTMEGGDEIGSVVISHKEFLGNITGSISFENSSFQLNPGLVSTFPWLSQLAVNYEEYSFEQLMFTYVSLLSEATASGAVGSVIMTTNYNAGNPAFVATTDMLNNVGTVSARPTDSPIIHGVECDDEKNILPSYYVRVGAVPTGQDIKTYDQGLFQIATEGMPADNQLQGQLWVSYQITLRKPKLFTAAGKGILCDMFKSSAGIVSTKMTGTPLYYSPYNTIGVTLSTPQTNSLRISFPTNLVQGLFKVVIQYDNPLTGVQYPSSPTMAPTLALSNCVVATSANNAQYFGVQNAQYPTLTYNTVAPNFHYETLILLQGSFAIPTYLQFNWAALATNFVASQFSCQVIQSNPRFTASTSSTVPPEWYSLTL